MGNLKKLSIEEHEIINVIREDIRDSIVLNSSYEISIMLMRSNPNYKKQDNWKNDKVITELKCFIKLLKIIEKLGMLEHSGDWDPYLIIKLTDGRTIETEAGYFDFIECDEENKLITITTWEEEREEFDLVFDIDEIISIDVCQ